VSTFPFGVVSPDCHDSVLSIKTELNAIQPSKKRTVYRYKPQFSQLNPVGGDDVLALTYFKSPVCNDQLTIKATALFAYPEKPPKSKP